VRFLADQDVYHTTTTFLRSLGHDVLTARDAGLSRASDADLLQSSHALHRVLVSRDKGFGALVFRGSQDFAGAILLRMEPRTAELVHAELARFLRENPNFDWPSHLVVIEPFRHRVRRVQ
jgi:predicted nuclease of predicted toxin-antitoxin system